MSDIQLVKTNKTTNASELVLVDDIWESLGMDNLHVLRLNGAVTVGDYEYTWHNHPEWQLCDSCKQPVHRHRMWAYEDGQHHYVCLPVAYRLKVGSQGVMPASAVE